MSNRRVRPFTGLSGVARVPGDKSISHRSVIFGSIATGRTRVRGFLPGQDPLATIRAFRQMGVRIEQHAPSELEIEGVGLHGLKAPNAPIDVGNSGTTIRLMAGLMSGQSFDCVLDGDASIRRRPMKRVMGPLAQMGADIADADGEGHAPLRISALGKGKRLRAIDYESPVASAQVKSSILLAALYADGTTCVSEPAPSRDHTERMLVAMGVSLSREATRVCLSGGQQPEGRDIDVPGDISSAAFPIVASLISAEGEIVLRGVGMNPTRDGLIEALSRMGAGIDIENLREQAGEPVADLRVRPMRLRGTEIGGTIIPRMIDEIPAFAVAACFADGETLIRDAGELRVKESDRIATMTEELGKLGIEVEPLPDGMRIRGESNRRVSGGVVASHGDHRVAMSLAACAARADDEIVIEDIACVETSFPGFFELMESLAG